MSGEPADDAAIPQSIVALIEEVADLEPPVEVRIDGGHASYDVAGRCFAVASASVLEVDLGAEVASAAVRTPDTAAASPGSSYSAESASNTRRT